MATQMNNTKVWEAYRRIANSVLKTPCILEPALSDKLNTRVYLKLDNLQRTGSFKERGALNRLLLLSDEEKSRGVVTASAGNHAQAVAYHAKRLGVAATIFMPVNTPAMKATRTESWGAQVRFIGENYDETHEAAQKYAQESGAFYLHAYNDWGVIEGQGTLALEILEQVPQVDTILVPVGGGGLLAGMALALEDRPVRLIGVEAQNMPSMAQAIALGGPVTLPPAPTLADGIRVRRVGDLTYSICQSRVSEWLVAEENAIAHAMLYLLESCKLVAEGAGAAALVPVLENQFKDCENKSICVVISGGNIDVNLLDRVIERGMVESGRIARFMVALTDRPGQLSELLEIVGELQANVLKIYHDRTFNSGSLGEVEVNLVLQTRGKNHIEAIFSKILSKGYRVHV